MNGLMERLGGVFNKDKFDAELRNALKRRNFTVAGRNGDVYDITDGKTVVKTDLAKLRREYESGALTEEKLEELVRHVEKRCDMESRMGSFTNCQSFLRCVVMRERDVKSNMISADFVDGLKKVMVCTADDEELDILPESAMKQWAVPREVLFSVADRNMCRLLSRAEIKESEIADGVKVMEFELPCKHLAVSLMTCSDFRRVVGKNMGPKFLVVAPSRESLLILGNITNNVLERLGKVIIKEYKRSENPLTTDVMLFTADNIQIAGRFAVKDKQEPSEAGRSIT